MKELHIYLWKMGYTMVLWGNIYKQIQDKLNWHCSKSNFIQPWDFIILSCRSCTQMIKTIHISIDISFRSIKSINWIDISNSIKCSVMWMKHLHWTSVLFFAHVIDEMMEFKSWIDAMDLKQCQLIEVLLYTSLYISYIISFYTNFSKGKLSNYHLVTTQFEHAWNYTKSHRL